jgi:hypothetical protein
LFIGNGAVWTAITGGGSVVVPDSFKMMYPLQVYDSGGLKRVRIAYSWQDSALAASGGVDSNLLKSKFSADTATTNRLIALNFLNSTKKDKNDTLNNTGYLPIWRFNNQPNNWGLTGNSGTNVNDNFIGTTDDVPLYIRVNNDTIARFFSNGGIALNYADGQSNQANGFNSFSTGSYNKSKGVLSATVGGISNISEGNFSATVGGDSNISIGDGSISLGGSGNILYATFSVISGFDNISKGPYSFTTGVSNDTTNENSLFTLGNGIPSLNRSNALQVLQNAKTLLNNANSDSILNVKGGVSLQSIYPSTNSTDSALVINSNGGVGKRALSSGGGTTKYTTNGFGTIVDSTTNSYTIKADTNITAKLRDAAIDAKLNTTDAATTYYPLTGGSYLSATDGSGFLGLKAQSTPPTAPTSGLIKLYANSTGRLSWLTSLGFSRTINSRPLTASRTYTFYDRDYTVADSADVSLKANIASPNLTGTPTAPTAILGTNTTQIATTAFTLANAINSNYLRYYRFFTDFISGYGSGTSTSELFSTSSGTGAGFSIASEAGRPGIYQANSGTTATGRHSLTTPNSSTTLGGGTWTFETMLQVPTLSNATERFQNISGFFDMNTAANQTDGIYFLYDEGGVSTGSSATPNFQIVTSSNSVRTFQTTSTSVVANTWYKLKIVVNATATSVEYFINDVSVGTSTTNIPTGALRQLGWGLLQNKSVGITSRAVSYDAMLVEGRLTTSR